MKIQDVMRRAAVDLHPPTQSEVTWPRSLGRDGPSVVVANTTVS